MTDIIQDAKQLLKGATPGKWRAADSDIIAKDGNRFIATVSEYSGLDEPSEEYANVQLIAAAPDIAQALAEETWEYAVGEKWLTPLGAVWRLATEAQWYSSYRAAEESADPECHTRIVRRRVSPPEIINE